VRHSQVRPKLHQQFENPNIISKYAVWPGFDFNTDAVMEIFDGAVHTMASLAKLVTFVNSDVLESQDKFVLHVSA
jgi:hypothetical protein